MRSSEVVYIINYYKEKLPPDRCAACARQWWMERSKEDRRVRKKKTERDLLHKKRVKRDRSWRLSQVDS